MVALAHPLLKLKNETSTVVTTNTYDGLNRRIKRVEPTKTRHFYYNENWQVLAESDGGTTPTAIYSYHPQYIDAVAVRMEPTTTHYFLQDANFNVTAAIGIQTGSRPLVERYHYSPYGEVTILNGTTDADPGVTDFSPDADQKSDFGNEILFTGRRLDPETGLQLNRHRFYHAGLGRWVNRDPIGYLGGGYNLFEYVGGRPTRAMDPLGLNPMAEVCMGGGGGAGFGVGCFESGSTISGPTYTPGFGPIRPSWDYVAGTGKNQNIDLRALLDDPHVIDSGFGGVPNIIVNSAMSLANKANISCDNPTKTISGSGNAALSTSSGGDRRHLGDPWYSIGKFNLKYTYTCTVSLECGCCQGTANSKLKYTTSCSVAYSFYDRYANPTDIRDENYELNRSNRKLRANCIANCKRKFPVTSGPNRRGRQNSQNACKGGCIRRYPNSDPYGTPYGIFGKTERQFTRAIQICP